MIKHRIIINIHDDTPDEMAVAHVNAVIRSGRVSKGGASYCLCSIFEDCEVFADHIPSTGTDTFRVWRHKTDTI